MPYFLSLGRIHIPVFGLFAAAGLIVAMALGLRTARSAGVDRDAFWDVGMVAVLSAFVLSRLLLVAENLRTFLLYPVLVLELPSLTKLGLLATLIVVFLYVRRRNLPLLRVMDAAAPGAALLAASLNLGRLADGTREGLPTSLPWAVSSAFGRVHPLELYSLLAWSVVCLVLLRTLPRARGPGETAGWGLFLGGLTLFGMDFFRLPEMLYGTNAFDGPQWRGAEFMLAGALLVSWRLAARERPGHAAGAKEVGDAL